MQNQLNFVNVTENPGATIDIIFTYTSSELPEKMPLNVEVYESIVASPVEMILINKKRFEFTPKP